MGMNFYTIQQTNLSSFLSGDSSANDTYHIGKSSYGWVFSLHVDHDRGIYDLDDMLPMLTDSKRIIVDEDGKEISLVKLMLTIMGRSMDKLPTELPSYYSRNAILGEKNLLRSELGHNHCVKHGAGTWDCIIGDFS